MPLLQGLASPDHTTLLLNCYTKLKDVEKLDEFLKASGATDEQPTLRFDVDTAIKVRSYVQALSILRNELHNQGVTLALRTSLPFKSCTSV